MCFAPQRRALFDTKWQPHRQRAARPPGVFNIFASKCLSRHNDVHFFDISKSKSGPRLRYLVHFDFQMCSRHNGAHFFHIATSKSRPNMVCVATFHLQMCFAPQRCALFRHLNFQKWHEHVVFWRFSFKMCFALNRRATFHLSSGKLTPHPPL